MDIKNFVETDERVLRLNELHKLDREDVEMIRRIKKSKSQHKTTWG